MRIVKDRSFGRIEFDPKCEASYNISFSNTSMIQVDGLSIYDPGSNSPSLILNTNATVVKKYEVAYFLAFC